jgi:hypothetical protein
MNRDRVRKRLVKRSKRGNRVWSPKDIDRMLNEKEARRTNIKSKSLGIIKMAVSAAPLGAMTGSLVDHLVPDEILDKVPQIQEFAKEGTEAVEFDRIQGFSTIQIVLRDLVPTLRSFQEGNYVEGITGLATLVGLIAPMLA